jgi:hypothetical protein
LAAVEARGIHRTRRCASLYTYCIYELRALLARDRAGMTLGELHLEAMKLLVASLEKRRFAVRDGGSRRRGGKRDAAVHGEPPRRRGTQRCPAHYALAPKKTSAVS